MHTDLHLSQGQQGLYLPGRVDTRLAFNTANATRQRALVELLEQHGVTRDLLYQQRETPLVVIDLSTPLYHGMMANVACTLGWGWQRSGKRTVASQPHHEEAYMPFEHRIDFADSDVGVLAIYGGVKGAASSLEKAGRKACKEDTLGNRCSIINPYTGKATSEDQYRATIVTATVADAYAARDALHEMVSVDGHHDNSDFYRNERDGYKALHTTLEMNGYSFEIHIVTDKDDRANNERNADDERTHTSFKVRELNRMHSLDGHRVVMVETLGKGAYEVRDIDITNQVRSEGPLRATVISNYNKR